MKRFIFAALLIVMICQPAQAIYWLRAGQSVTIKMGPFVSSSDGFTLMNSLTISQADIRLAKNGGAFAQTNNSAGAVVDSTSGHYDVPLDTADTANVGKLRVFINESGALPVWQDFMVVPANVFDTMVAGTDSLTADVDEWSGTAVAAPDTAGYPKVTVKDGTGTGEIALTSGSIDVNVASWAGSAVAAPVVTGVPTVSVGYIGSSAAIVQSYAPTADSPLPETTVAVGLSPTTFTLTAGPTVNNVLVGWEITILDVSASETPYTGRVIAYNGTTKMVTLNRAPSFTPAAGDKVRFVGKPRN